MRNIFKKTTYGWFGILMLIIFVLVFHKLIYPFGPRVANDFHLAFREVRLEAASLPWTWNNTYGTGLGEYSVFVLWTWPLGVITSIIFLLFSQQFTLFIFLLILPIVFGAIGIKKIGEKLGFSSHARFISILIYFLNTYFILLLDGGQFNIVVAYGLFPLVFSFWKDSLSLRIKSILISSTLIAILGFLDVRILYILAVLIFLDFLFNVKDVVKYLVSGTGALVMFVLLHAYWLTPSLIAKVPSLPVNYERSAQVTFLSFAKWKHALLLLQPHWYKNVFGKVVDIKWEFAIIPVLVFLAPILAWINSTLLTLKGIKTIGFWSVVALVGVFLVKGANPPLIEVYPWLFINVPGFSLFRDPTKFFFLVALSYSVLIGYTMDELIKRFNWKLKIINRELLLISLLVSTYFLLIVRPVWLGKMTGLLSEPIQVKESFQIAEILKTDEKFGRVFWIPTKAPLGYFSPTHPSVEASRLVQKRPFAAGVVGTYEIFNFVREAPYMGELFDISAIKYIAYPYPDTRREELKQDNIDYYYSFSDQIENLSWVNNKISKSPVQVFTTKQNQDHLFIASNTFLVVGSDDIYKDLVEIKDFSLSENAMIFSEERPGLGGYAGQSDAVILNNKSVTDFAATYINEDKFLFPANFLDFSPGESGWWKRETTDFVWWRDFLQQKYGIDNQDFDYGGGYAIAEGNLGFTIQDSRFKKDEVMLARVMVSSRGGKVGFYQGDVLLGEVNTAISKPEITEIKLTGYREIPDQYFEYDKAKFKWFEVGGLSTNLQPLTIKTEGDINVVNSLAFVSKEEWQQINKLIHEFNIVDWNDLFDTEKRLLFSEDTRARISYKRYSPTHYRVFVENIDEPVTLAFSETYDTLWEISGQNMLSGSQASYPLYSLINGFYIERDGVYDINFSAQKYIYPGLAISIFTASALGIYLLISKKVLKI